MNKTIANTDQAEYWSSPAGHIWATHQEHLDTLMSEVLSRGLEYANPQQGERVLDIGCGTGASTLGLTRAVGGSGQVTGLDISEPLLDLARHRANSLEHAPNFVLGDAQVHAFPAEEADLIFSRFGVMFFGDPIQAFSNLRRATRSGGRLLMVCWQGAPQNPWFMLPMKCAVKRLGQPEPLDPLAPGPMAFKDIDRVTGILSEAGWASVKGDPVDVDLVPPQSLSEAAEFATTVGPATRLIRERNASPEDVSAIRQDCANAFREHLSPSGLRIPAAVNIFSAVNDG